MNDGRGKINVRKIVIDFCLATLIWDQGISFMPTLELSNPSFHPSLCSSCLSINHLYTPEVSCIQSSISTRCSWHIYDITPETLIFCLFCLFCFVCFLLLFVCLFVCFGVVVFCCFVLFFQLNWFLDNLQTLYSLFCLEIRDIHCFIFLKIDFCFL